MRRMGKLIVVLLVIALVIGRKPEASSEGMYCGNTYQENTYLISVNDGAASTKIKVVDFSTLSEEKQKEYWEYRLSDLNMTFSSGWMESFDLYYKSLSSEEKKIFNQITVQVSNEHPECVIETQLGMDAVGDVVMKWQYSAFSLESYKLYPGLSISSVEGSGKYYVEMNYDDCNTSVFEEMLENCISSASGYDDLYGKLKAVHGWIIDNCEYDHDMDNPNQSAGSIADGKTVCAGFARFYALVCLRMGIPANVISSDGTTTGIGHSFNYIFVDDGDGGFLTYICDVTWDLYSWSDEQWGWFLIGRISRDARDEDNYHSDLDEIGLSVELQEEDYADRFEIKKMESTDDEDLRGDLESEQLPTEWPIDDPWFSNYDPWNSPFDNPWPTDKSVEDNYGINTENESCIRDESDVSNWDIISEPEPMPTAWPTMPPQPSDSMDNFDNTPVMTEIPFDTDGIWDNDEGYIGIADQIPVVTGIPFEENYVTDIPFEESIWNVTTPTPIFVEDDGKTPEYRYEYRFNDEGFIIWEHVRYSDGSEMTSWTDVGSLGHHYEYKFNGGGAIIQLWQTVGPCTWTETFEYDDFGNIVKHNKYYEGEVITELRKYNKKGRQTKLIVIDSDGKKKTYKFKYKKGILVKYPYVCGSYSENGITCFQVCVNTYDKNGDYKSSKYYLHGKRT